MKVRPVNVTACVDDLSRLNSVLLKHVRAGVEATMGAHTLSTAFDKTNVGGIRLQAGVTVTPNSYVFCAVRRLTESTRFNKPSGSL